MIRIISRRHKIEKTSGPIETRIKSKHLKPQRNSRLSHFASPKFRGQKCFSPRKKYHSQNDGLVGTFHPELWMYMEIFVGNLDTSNLPPTSQPPGRKARLGNGLLLSARSGPKSRFHPGANRTPKNLESFTIDVCSSQVVGILFPPRLMEELPRSPVDMVNILLFTGFYTSQVVHHFFHQP